MLSFLGLSAPSSFQIDYCFIKKLWSKSQFNQPSSKQLQELPPLSGPPPYASIQDPGDSLPLFHKNV
jgi:hypothetical protein